MSSGGANDLSALEFLLTNSSDGKEWIFPKGGWETDESATEGAARECYEEAGVKGDAIYALPTIEVLRRSAPLSTACALPTQPIRTSPLV